MTTPIATGLDLDGTLIDTTIRQKAALIKAAQSLGVELPAYFPDRYYEEKRRGISGKEVLIRHDIAKAEQICAFWTDIIEDHSRPRGFEEMGWNFLRAPATRQG